MIKVPSLILDLTAVPILVNRNNQIILRRIQDIGADRMFTLLGFVALIQPEKKASCRLVMLNHGYRASLRDVFGFTLHDSKNHTSITKPNLKAGIGHQMFVITRWKIDSDKVNDLAITLRLDCLYIFTATFGTYPPPSHRNISTMAALETFDDHTLLRLCHLSTSTLS
jgi:hypothetical protein